MTSMADKMWNEGKKEAALEWYRFAAEQSGVGAQVALELRFRINPLHIAMTRNRSSGYNWPWVGLIPGRTQLWQKCTKRDGAVCRNRPKRHLS